MKIAIACISVCIIVGCVENTLGASPVTYDPDLYTFLSVSNKGKFGSISNSGEIVYTVNSSVGTELFSSTRGLLVTDPTGLARYPSVNDSGEVVYEGSQTSGTGPWTIWSTTRGQIAFGSTPGINNNGEVSFARAQFSPSQVSSSTRGALVTLPLGSMLGFTDINDSGEIIYTINGNFLVGGPRQTFSTTRGLLLSDAAYGARLNNYGDVLYSGPTGGPDRSAIYSLDGTRLTDFTAINPLIAIGLGDLNDYGDFVFSASTPKDGMLVLATQRPWYYPEFRVFNPAALHVPDSGPTPVLVTPILVLLLSLAKWFPALTSNKRR